MSVALKAALAEELGVAEQARTQGWGSVSAGNCGRLVKLAIARAEKALVQSDGRR